jgi:hypothetical protein
MKLYLDIDGVLLTTKNTCAAKYVEEFVDFITTHFDCYWLTTHVKGDASTALRYIKTFINERTYTLLQNVKATNWIDLKTEGIDLNNPFLWLDDQAMNAEQAILVANNCEDSFLLVDLNNEEELKELVAYLKDYIKQSIKKPKHPQR